MAVKVGYEHKAYRDVSGTWTLMSNVKDVEISLQRDRADVTTRGTNGWKTEKPTLATMEVTFEMNYDPASADYTALANAFFNNTNIEMAFADGPIATEGTVYFTGNFGVAEFSQNEPLAEAVSVSVTLVPSDPTTPPTRVVVEGEGD